MRWLGLWLDLKLTFRAHIHRMEQRGKATLTQLHRISRCYHGLNAKEARVLVATILKPRVLFGSIVWFNTRTEGKVSRILTLLQNKANRLIMGAFKSSPITFLNHDTDTKQFKDLAIRHHHNYIYKRLTAPPTHPTRRILQQDLLSIPNTHLSPIQQLIRRTDLILPGTNVLETIYPYPEPPWTSPRWEVENKDVKRDEAIERIPDQVELEKKEGACVIFTDGSYIPQVGAGAAIALDQHAAGHAYGPLEGVSNYEMETMAFILAMTKFKQLIDRDPDRFKALAIFSDSQAALNLITKPMHPTTLQYLTRYVLRTWKLIPECYQIRLYWTPGHEGVELNERADQEAKEAAEKNNNPVMLPMSLGCLLRRVQDTFKTRGADPIKPYETKGRWIADALNSLEKGQAAAIFQLRCGHCPLKKFLHRIGAEEDDRCETCKAVETPAHFLIYCKRYKKERRTFRQRLKEEEIKIDFNSARKLLDTPKVFPLLAQFIQETGRFQYLASYLDN